MNYTARGDGSTRVVRYRSSDVREHEPGLTGIGLAPSFAIGQRMLLVETDSGNVLWDMIPVVCNEGLAAVRDRGGARAIAISHPHYYGAASAWSEALGGVPVLVHAADAEWVTRPDAAIEDWEGDVRELTGGLTLLRLGGHFPGATVLHWPGGADGRGALLSGDVVMALPDRNVSFMWSYPNLVPLPAGEVERIGTALEPWPFERIDGRLEASEGLVQVSRELRALNDSLNAVAYAALGQSPQVRRRAG